MNRKLHPLAAAVAIAAFAFGAQAQNTTQPTQQGAYANDRAGVSEQDREFMKNAAEAGKAEVQAAQLALQKSNDQAVRQFAQRLIQDHTHANAQLKQLAQAKAVKLPSDPSALQKSKLEMLRAADGTTFNQQFADSFGVKAHHKAIDLFRKEVDQGRDPDVKAFARKVLDTLQQHLAIAQNTDQKVAGNDRAQVTGVGAVVATNGTRAPVKVDTEDLRDAQQEINGAVQVVQRMKADPRMQDTLARAKGVFILPHYGRGGLGVGVQGGEGVLVTRNGEHFSNPVFYNLGGVSIGAQAGVAGGPVAFVLMTDKAVQSFKSGQKFSLNADAGLTVVAWSARAQGSTGAIKDVIVWSNTVGAYAGVSLGVTDIMLDKEANRAYYGREGLQPGQIIDGQVPNPRSNVLGLVLSA